MLKLKNLNKKTIELDEIEKIFKIKSYKELYKLVNTLINNKEINPIRSTGGNGKNPTLYKRYRVIEEEEDYSELLNELSFKLSPKLEISYYKNHLKKYKEHREYILKLNEFIINKETLLKQSVSMNERSFQIWGREKFIQKEEGKLILKNLGLDLGYLNYYETSEPLAYYSKSKKVPQNILILENKDTYYTMRKYLINGGNEILEENISTLIYGGGKNVNKAFKDFEISVEEYVSNKENKLLYFGDLDYEGIVIYESLYNLLKEKYRISPFISGYKKMIDKYIKEKIILPKTKEGQNRNIKDEFLNKFDNSYRIKINEILENGLYIPQEILNISDL
ncbi:Wadjet anti-phage system protein JetD domain-containing protein [Clostridium sp. ZBS15]|uniref:Wadjet anti-phage system protein JetD domain-containing protein n=1 Tax=Clostridium sp. ZBS15 TaxID=2949969 RepID=UPI0020798FB2|nr:Wadjet anti-phage system protein JetD domain-containing protein [Clostridium sp. ZBS15]